MTSSEEPDVAGSDPSVGAPEETDAAPDSRLQPLFDLAHDVAASSEEAVAAAAETEDYGTRFDSYVLERGIKGLKSAQLLISSGYWEHATAVARQLFEMLVNMEHLATSADRESALKLYNSFGLLQFFLAEMRRIDYEKDHGRPADTRWESSVKDALSRYFDHFKLPPRSDGKPRWRSSWSGKTTRALAESSTDPMRALQYELLFTAWSEQTHATPGVFTTELFDRFEEEVAAEAFAEIEEALRPSVALLTGVGRREAQTLAMTIVLFLQLWQRLPGVVPPRAEDVDSWLSRVRKFMALRVIRPRLPIAD
jgi:hypothetical protein